VVHLVTNDSDFYEGRDRTRGLSVILREEVENKARHIRIYPTLKDFLASMGETVAAIDEKAIGAAIINALIQIARDIAAGPRDEEFELGTASQPLIRGFATPKTSEVAISFETTYQLARTEIEDGEARQLDAVLRIRGVCSYDPNRNEVSDVEVREWSKSLREYERDGYRGTMWSDPKSTAKQFGPQSLRLIEER
jgi:hypothetical protein